MQSTEVVKKCDFNRIEVGEIVSRTSYLVINAIADNSVNVENPQGISWNINGTDIVETEVYGSRQFDEVITLPISKLARAFMEVPGDAVFTVSFTKKDGTERILTGHRTNSEEDITSLGISMVIDLEKEFQKEYPVRNIYHTSLNWFICKNKKYTLKK